MAQQSQFSLIDSRYIKEVRELTKAVNALIALKGAELPKEVSPFDLLTVDKTAEATGLKKSTLYTLKSLGKIKGTKVGKRLMFSPADILEYFTKNTITQ